MGRLSDMRRSVIGGFAGLLALAVLAGCDQTAGFGGPARTVDASAPVNVALLVPLGSGEGEMNFLGSSLVNAARMARNDISGADINLQVYETGGNAQTAAAVAQRAMDEGAQIIVGPLFSTAAAAVAPIAAQRGVQVLTFSNNADIAGNNLFLLGVTFETIADRVVRYSVAQGSRDIAVIHSNDVAGLAGRAAAEGAIRSSGALLPAHSLTSFRPRASRKPHLRSPSRSWRQGLRPQC